MIGNYHCQRLLAIGIGLLSHWVLVHSIDTPNAAAANKIADKLKRLPRIRFGMQYKDHDEVKLTVTKVGPYNNPSETYRYYSLPFCQEHHDEEPLVEEANGDDEDNAEDEKKLMLFDALVKNSEKLTKKEITSVIERQRKLLAKRLGAQRHRQRLGESLLGNRRESTPYILTFGDSVQDRTLCSTTLKPEQLQALKNAIHNSYFFEMYIEDLPMWGYIGDITDEDVIVGEVEGVSHTYLFTHLIFELEKNKDRIVSATVKTDPSKAVDITKVDKPLDITFTYDVSFADSTTPWKDRMQKYIGSEFRQKTLEIHWLSIINAFVLVLLLLAFLTILLMRILKNDLARYMQIEDESLEEEESGWKLIHGDVFRFPENNVWFCACVGTGLQLVLTTFAVLGMSLLGWISTTKRGSILAGCVITYVLLSVFGGYFATRLYLQMNGKNWARCVSLTGILFPLPLMGIFSLLNSIALAHRSTIALPFGTLISVLALYLMVSVPMTLFGGILAKNFAQKDFNAPTRTTKVAREIPSDIPWFKGRFMHMIVAGCLPFSAIYIELRYIFASMWGHQLYTMFGVLLVAFVLLIIVTSAITVALLYFQLSREDHRWWWMSFTNGGIFGVVLYLYSFHYYYKKSGMTGLLQGSYYFGYMAIISFASFLMLGSVAFQSSLFFVKYIYSRVKCD